MRIRYAQLIVPALAGVSLVLGACKGPQHTPNDTTIAKTTATEPLTGRVVVGMPIELHGHSTVLVPMSLETHKGLFEDKDPYTRPSRSRAAYRVAPDRYARPGSVGARREVRWHNAIFANTRGEAQWQLLNERGVISAWTPYIRAHGSETGEQRYVTELLIFEVTTEDTNGDGLLDERDVRQLVATKGNGRDPRVISPAGAQVWETDYDFASRTLFMRVAQDTNRDGWYDTNDAPVIYAWKLNQTGPATTLVDPEVLTDAVHLLLYK